jgi:hypothetical protein
MIYNFSEGMAVIKDKSLSVERNSDSSTATERL